MRLNESEVRAGHGKRSSGVDSVLTLFRSSRDSYCFMALIARNSSGQHGPTGWKNEERASKAMDSALASTCGVCRGHVAHTNTSRRVERQESRRHKGLSAALLLVLALLGTWMTASLNWTILASCRTSSSYSTRLNKQEACPASLESTCTSASTTLASCT